LLLVSHNGSDFVRLKFRSRKSLYLSTIEPATPGSRSFEPTMHCVPGDLFDSSDGGLVEAFNAESRHFIEGSTTVLESMIRCSGRRAERLPTNLALVATTLPPSGLVKAVSDDPFGSGLSRLRALSVCTAETLHGLWN
jgi:hypothetical protein